ncbi:MAG: sulfite exporter TauE/SafE family protein [Pseudomonadota bacterium]
MTQTDLLYAALVLSLAYFVRGISGFGSGLIAVPLLALRFPLPQVVPFMLIADFTASALIGGLHFKHVDKEEVRRLLPASLAGVALGTSMLVSLPAGILLGSLAAFILIFALRFLFMRPGPFAAISPRWAYPAALTGGAVGGLFGTGGPPYVIYLSHRIQDKGILRATLSGLFFMEGLIRIGAFLIAGLLLDLDIWLHALWALPIVVAALYAGGHVHTRLSHMQMQRLIGLLLLASALSVLLKAYQADT